MKAWSSEIQSENPLLGSREKLNLAILAVILFAAFALRLYRLNSGLWLDEILTYVNYARMPLGRIVSTYDSENQHFFYSLVTHASFWVFGESAWSLRLPAVLFGVGSIWALYLLGHKVGDAREALLSAALLAFSYHHVWFSQNARGYTGLLFWTLLASWLFLRGLGEARPRFWLLYAAAAALGVYTHLTMIFVIIGHLFSYLITIVTQRKQAWSKRWTGFFLGFCAAGLLTLLLHAPALPQMFDTVGGTEKSVVAAWKDPLWTLVEILNGLQIGFLSGIVALVALLLFGAGLISYMRTNPIVVQLLVVPPIVGSTVVIGVGHHLWPRFFFFAMGFGALVFIRGIMVLGQLAAKLLKVPSDRSVWVGTGLCIGLILVSTVSMTFAYGPKQDYVGALDYIAARKEPGDAVVTVGLASYAYKNLYQTDWQEVKTLAALDAIRSRMQRTWLVYTFPPVEQSVYPEIMDTVQRDFKVVKEFSGTVRGGTIFVCRSDTPPSYSSLTTTGPSTGAQ